MIAFEQIGIAIGAGAFLLWVLSRSYVRVDEGHLAVLIAFGAVVREGKGLKLLPPGLHSKAPWHQARIVSMKEQNLDLSGEEGGRVAMAEDGTLLRFDSILRFVPTKKDLEAYLFGTRHRREHITGLFTCLLRNEIANFRSAPPEGGPVSQALARRTLEHGSYALIRRERQLLNKRIMEFVRDSIGANYGLDFSAVDLTDILPPDELANALNAVLSAQAEAEAQYARAEGDCQQRVLAAERGVEIAKARAKAAEIEITKLGEYLAQLSAQHTLRAYVARRRAEILSESRSIYYKAERSAPEHGNGRAR
jgi:regulator of protease activity HflC (stomatin/prohibitin superfamily)